jgi:hypothetical protein
MPNEILLEGTISVSDELAGGVPEGASLFLMGRPAGHGGKGPPVLVKKIHPVKLPAAFRLTGADTMMARGQMPDSYHLSVRLDQDGDAISKTPGDLEGELSDVKRGTSGIVLKLTKALTEGRPSAPVQ